MLLKRLSVKLTSAMISSGTVKEEDREVYQYSIEVVAAVLINILSSVVLFSVFGMLIECLLFFAIFFPLRTYSGGHHMASHLGCYLLSMLIMLLVIICIRIIPEGTYFASSVLLVAFSSMTIILFSPIEDRNRPIDEIERPIYRRKSLKVLAVELLAFLLLLILSMERAAFIVSIALAVTALSMLFALLNRTIYIRKSDDTYTKS